MNNDLGQIYYSKIQDIPYDKLFRTLPYNGKALNDADRRNFVQMIDEEVAFYEEGIKMVADYLEEGFAESDLGDIQRAIFTTVLFVKQVVADCVVASKYFLMADTDYDKRFMRGKFKVILNEGFKQLYGFKNSKKSETVWGRLEPLMRLFPQKIKEQYAELSAILDEQSKVSSWWKEERDMETHLDAKKLYHSRREELIESKVMIESLSLINSLRAVDCFITNVNGCVLNALLDAYYRGELREE